MKQVLTQQEIDSLLDALDTGDIDTSLLDRDMDMVKTYDFRRPIKLSKEYMNSLYMIFENFSKMVGNVLSSQLHVTVDVGLGAVEQLSFDEFIKSIPKVTFLSIFQSKPLTGMQVLEIHPQFCAQIVELVCGGVDSRSKAKGVESKEEFTDIELGILEEAVESILKAFRASWDDIVEMETKIDHLITNPQLVQNMSPNEPVVLVSFTVDVLGVRSFMNICIPFASFENIMDKLSFRSWFDIERKEDNTKEKEILKDRIISSTVELSVGLGNSIITVNDFLDLEDGDILQLDTETNEPLKMYVEGRPHFLVKPGQYNGSLAIEVLQYIEEDLDL